ncbi:hypothetical protein Poly30_10110 [Planctomycetes bacterium Poly30]|uniref:Uncharacterized protein n=1 Tax=Saltatorellus ferox TaxID=2528018 RepID=A0A518EN51_9BACT|nr:hypothetical protein Poly30_10110 [Planctomycetes bacterium Poly30]
MLKNIACAILLLGAASCSLTPKYSVYGADLETREGARVILWANDEGYGTFRCVVERKGEGAESVRVLRSAGDLASLAKAGPIAGASVMLPPDVTEAQRGAAASLLAELGALQPRMSAHLVVTEVPWRDVRSVDDLIDRSRECRDLVQPQRNHGVAVEELMLLMQPDLLIAPAANVDGTAPDSFLVAATPRVRTVAYANDAKNHQYSRMLAEDLHARIATAPASELARQQQNAIVILPYDADQACRERCQQLMVQLLADAVPTWAISWRTSETMSAEDLRDPESLAEMLAGRIIAAPSPKSRE